MEQVEFNKEQSTYGSKSNRCVQMFESISDEQFINHKRLLGRVAKEFNRNYVWTPEISSIAADLIYYFNGLDKKWDLNKSIALCGTYGVGKTYLMKIFKSYINKLTNNFNHPNIFRIISIEDVIQYMSSKDPIDSEVLFNVKTELDRPVRRPANILINEFGFKYNGKSFGTEYQELIEMFIMKRYDIFQDYGKLTHVTMNLGTEELESVFSEKIVDRFKEMFNIIHLEGSSFRK